MKYIYIIVFIFYFVGCGIKNDDYIDLVVINKSLTINQKVIFELHNKSNQNYFLPLSDLNFENNSNDFYLYNSIFIQPILYELNGKLLKQKNNYNLVKHTKNSFKKNFDCINIEINKAEKHRFNLVNIKNIVKIKSNSTSYFKQDIENLNSILCNDFIKSRYDLIKGKKYLIQFEYTLDKNYFLETVNKAMLSKLKSENFLPYYGKLTSNKIILNYN